MSEKVMSEYELGCVEKLEKKIEALNDIIKDLKSENSIANPDKIKNEYLLSDKVLDGGEKIKNIFTGLNLSITEPSKITPYFTIYYGFKIDHTDGYDLCDMCPKILIKHAIVAGFKEGYWQAWSEEKYLTEDTTYFDDVFEGCF